jgi:hypothetical protein
MTYEQNIRKVTKRLEMAHFNSLQKGTLILKGRAQAKESLDITAEAIRKCLNHFSLAESDEINEYLFSQGLIIIP